MVLASLKQNSHESNSPVWSEIARKIFKDKFVANDFLTRRSDGWGSSIFDVVKFVKRLSDANYNLRLLASDLAEHGYPLPSEIFSSNIPQIPSRSEKFKLVQIVD
jgi:hypothetical protein